MHLALTVASLTCTFRTIFSNPFIRELKVINDLMTNDFLPLLIAVKTSVQETMLQSTAASQRKIASKIKQV